MIQVLVIDDEPGIRSTLTMILEDEDYSVCAVEDAPSGIEMLEKEDIPLILLDVWLPKMGGIDALQIIKERWPETEVIIISGHANVDMAVKAVKFGAFDFLEKPLSLDKVLTVVRNALSLRSLKKENAGLKKAIGKDEIIGTSEPIMAIRQLIDQSAKSDARILITGENGTGKELVARAIHRGSKRSEYPFVEVNCAAIPDTLIESELFGHEKGAFTDAVSSRKGRFELASGGTLFLDEIGDMSLSAQAKVLRAIQEQKIERVGGEKVISVDVRIIAATNKDLKAACRDGSFREDLFFRLNVIPIHVPTLRDRPDDIPQLLYAFLGQLGYKEIRLDESATDMLKKHSWPGNVRELRNVAERIAILVDDTLVKASSLETIFQYQEHINPDSNDFVSSHRTNELYTLPYSEAKEAFERSYLGYKLKENSGIISKTAEAIGMYPSNLHAKIKKLGIKVEE